MNYVLISISTLVSRSKTIAMLKVGGARPSDIFRIFLFRDRHPDLRFGHRGRIPVVGPAGSGAGITGTPMSELFALKRIWVPLLVILAAFALCRAYPVAYFSLRFP